MKNKNKIMSRFELLRTLLAVGIAVVFAVVIIFLVSSQPLEAIYKFFVAPLTSFRYIANIIELMTPLHGTGGYIHSPDEGLQPCSGRHVLCGRSCGCPGGDPA